MMTPIPGSLAIPTLGVPTTLVSLDPHALIAAAVCVGASLVLAWGVMHLQRRETRQPTSKRSPVVGLPLVGRTA